MKRLATLLLVLCVLLCLCACGGAPAVPTEPAPAPTAAPTEAPEIPTAPTKKNYTVTVIDENDNPVPGVRIEVDGIAGITDEMGVAAFALEVGEYAVVIQELPFGYEFSAEAQELVFEEGVTYLTVIVNVADGTGEDSELEEGETPVEETIPEEIIPEG